MMIVIEELTNAMMTSFTAHSPNTSISANTLILFPLYKTVCTITEEQKTADYSNEQAAVFCLLVLFYFNS